MNLTARVIMDSPRAAAARASVYHRHTRRRPRERGLRVFAAAGSLLVHVLFLFSFVLGPAYEVVPPPPAKQQFVQVRLIETAKPPVARGTPAKLVGPRHQGHVRRLKAMGVSASARVPSPTTEAAAVTPPARKVVAHEPVPVRPVAKKAVTAQVKAKTPSKASPALQPRPKVARAKHAPTRPRPLPSIRPLLQAPEPPRLSIAATRLPSPEPPPLQPQVVRRPQLEGNQPVLPPILLVSSTRPPRTSMALAVPSVVVTPGTSPPVDLAHAAPLRAPAAAPAAPPLQPIDVAPMPSVSKPSIRWQPTALVRPTIQRLSTPMDAVAVPAASPPTNQVADLPTLADTPAPAIDVAAKLARPAFQPPAAMPLPRMAPVAVAELASLTRPASPARAASAPKTPATPTPLADSTPSTAGVEAVRNDVSTAPDATPAGSDSAASGRPDGSLEQPPSTPSIISSSGHAKADGQSAEVSSAATGAATNGLQGAAPSPAGYVQLKPHGDTEIMRHRAPDIGYRPTRFSKDWAPYGESSVDTALRHAVEKTTVGHTFHLPRGVRIRCTLTPLRLVSLFGCSNPDPPPKPVAEKVYDRLHLPPANPLLPVTPASAVAPAAAAPIRLDNSAECAAARVTGGPMPPGCPKPAAYRPIAQPASTSSAWVPASDQFH